ncbi:MAG: OmpA family protein [Haliscomenobacter sp.]|nr:OmpA family protein [Haliscomenobacter sp.]
MKKFSFVIWAIALFFGLGSCVPQRQHLDLVNQKDALEKKVAFQDSIHQLSLEESSEFQELNADYLQTVRTVEQLRSTNISLNQSYQELLQRYTNIVNQNREMLNTSSDMQQSLRNQADSRTVEVQDQYQKLAQLQQDLTLREQCIKSMETQYSQTLDVRNQEILDLQVQLEARDRSLSRAQSNLSTSLQDNIQDKNLSVRQTSDRIYITVSQDLLFKSGSSQMDNRGKATLRSVATALNQETNMDIIVEGHTDNTGSTDRNWELSTARALAVCKELIAQGIDPQRLTAAGRGSYAPVASNNSRKDNR